MLHVLPCQDSPAAAEACRTVLDIPHERAAELGRTAVHAADEGHYLALDGRRVDWAPLVARAVAGRRSVRPSARLPRAPARRFPWTTVVVRNETTLAAAQRLAARNVRTLTLNFANGENPGGGFLHGALAQEEALCRSSALYATLRGDRMYEAHACRSDPDASDWIILSPAVPVFRSDAGDPLPEPWLADFATCAAPQAAVVGVEESGDLMESRIRRLFEVTHAYEYEALVLGAWGCGAFANDPHRIAGIFHEVLASDFLQCFSEVDFAIADFTPDRRYLGPFRDTFARVGAPARNAGPAR